MSEDLAFGLIGVGPDYCPRCLGPCRQTPPCHVQKAFTAPDFARLRAERDTAIEVMAREVHIKFGGDPDTPVTFHAHGYGGCYCACPDGPCEHQFSGWREFDDGRGGEQVCQLCGTGAMSHSMRCLP